ncbi:uncharacterized protein LOC114543261, partial [Dendronephthya gigantea]|uniref:uncharacterized protein LOC114543261 n=1 Tax=Dendronephthya gigantea TaxID=151771 RepID=UPI00106B9CB7
MNVGEIINTVGHGLILLMICCCSSIAADYQHRRKNRTCIPAEAEPTLNSSSCFPLVNFTRPFCKNHGIILSNYVFRTPSRQNTKNNELNRVQDTLERLGELKISLYSKISVTKVRICIPILNIYLCHLFFPSCDRTQSVYKEKAACRETRVNVYHLCDYVSIRETFKKYFSIRWSGATPERKKFILGDLQPVRNAGDSPECWYTEFRNTTDRLTIVGTSANIVDGNYGNWSLKDKCNVSCGEGFETWQRDCDKPKPKFGGKYCSEIGESVEYRSCLAEPCP